VVLRVNAGGLNLRSGPSTGYRVLTAMPCGAEVLVGTGRSSSWVNVNYEGLWGWASSNYLATPTEFNPAVCR
jgi:uncharacterized protein YraI